MLDAALGLSRLVKEQDDMSWDNVDKVQAYIAKLKQHTDQLARWLALYSSKTICPRLRILTLKYD